MRSLKILATFLLLPKRYKVSLKASNGSESSFEIDVIAGEIQERVVELEGN